MDLPGIIEGAASGKGRGRQVIAVGKSSDLILMVLDAQKGNEQKEKITRELESVGIRLNKDKPLISLKVMKTGGIIFNAAVKLTKIDEKMVRSVLAEYKMHNCHVSFRGDHDVDDFIDVIEDAYNSHYSGHQLNPKNEVPHKDQQALQKVHQEDAGGDMEQSTKRH